MSVIPPPNHSSNARLVEVDIQRAMSRIGSYVRDFRTDGWGLTQQDLADKAGVDRNTIMRIEGGELGTAATLLRVLHALGAMDGLLQISANEEVLALASARLISKQQSARVARQRELAAEDDSDGAQLSS